ncbi:MAG TPA: site-specific integrase, partial [Burkholderiales bacterium]|nr:site-specific integrase [Burkholderiales bacterium]
MASFRRLPSGRWQAQIRRAGQSSLTRSFLKRQSALQWARSVEREIDQGVFVDRSEAFQTSVGQLIDRYLNEVTPGKKSAAKEARRLRLLKERF